MKDRSLNRKAIVEAERSFVRILGVVTHGNSEVTSEMIAEKVVDLRRSIVGLLNKQIITQDKHDRLMNFLGRIENAAKYIR